MSAPSSMKWVEIDLSAIAGNAAWVRAQLPRGAGFVAAVKADGYGHGAVEVSKAVLKAGAERLGVRDLAEAAALRQAGIKAPIQMLAPVLPEQSAEALGLGVIPVVESLVQARALQRAARGGKIRLQVDLDFGLARWGLPPKERPALMKAIGLLRGVTVDGIAAHLGYLPGKNAVEAEEKLGAFARLTAPYKRRDPSLRLRAANSTVFMDFPHRRFDLACVGNLLYGINRSKSRPPALKTPWRFRARVLSVREVRKGASIGYASEYLAPRAMRVAALPVGYADGLTMQPAERLIGLGASQSYWALRGAVKLPFVGRCGISHVLVDATSCPSLKPGDAVALPVRRTAARAPRVYR
ncbi:MAG: alanine racemase [Elusimicrobia bacterium]|nr:alanine racemase [Elusimicrobiota bacterium]